MVKPNRKLKASNAFNIAKSNSKEFIAHKDEQDTVILSLAFWAALSPENPTND
jgi:hypothetical protein